MRNFTQHSRAGHADKGPHGQIDALGQFGGTVGTLFVGRQPLESTNHIFGTLLLACTRTRRHTSFRRRTRGSQHGRATVFRSCRCCCSIVWTDRALSKIRENDRAPLHPTARTNTRARSASFFLEVHRARIIGKVGARETNSLACDITGMNCVVGG
jgi:hypothetical protein